MEKSHPETTPIESTDSSQGEKALAPEAKPILLENKSDRISWYSRRLEEEKPQECMEYRSNLDNLLAEFEEFLKLLKEQQLKDFESEGGEIGQPEKSEPIPELDELYRQQVEEFIKKANALAGEFGPAIQGSEYFTRGEAERKQYKFLAEQAKRSVGFFDLLTKSGRAQVARHLPRIKTWADVISENDQYQRTGETKKIIKPTPLNLAATRINHDDRREYYLNLEKSELSPEQNWANENWRKLIIEHQKLISQFKTKLNKLLNRPPSDFTDYQDQITEIKNELKQSLTTELTAFSEFFKTPILGKINALISLGWPITQDWETKKKVFNTDETPGLNLGLEDFFQEEANFVNKKIDLNASWDTVKQKITNDYQFILSRLGTKSFFSANYQERVANLEEEFNRDAWCLAWHSTQLAEFDDLLSQVPDEIRGNNIESVSRIEKNRDSYLDNCEILSRTVLIHNSNNVFLEEAVRNGRISSHIGSQELYGDSIIATNPARDNSISFVAVNPEILEKGANWTGHSYPKKARELPPKILAKRGYGEQQIRRIKEGLGHWEDSYFGQNKTSGMFIGIGDIFESVICQEQTYLEPYSSNPQQGKVDRLLRSIKNNPDEISQQNHEVCLTFDPRQHGSVPLHIDLSYTKEHRCPAVFYFPESARIKLKIAKTMEEYKKKKQYDQEELEEIVKNYERSHDFESCAKEAGWGIDENGEFDEQLFDRQVDECCIFYPDDANLREVYPWLVFIAADKIKEFHKGGRRGIYLTQDSEANKITWLPLEQPSKS